jgi:hypothetical protein
VLFAKHHADETDHRVAVAEDADDVGAAADLFVQALLRVVGPDLAPVRLREAGERQMSEPASSSISAAAGNRSASCSITRVCCACVVGASGWAKIERTSVATNGPADFGTRVSRLRRKWVLHLCQLAPGRVEAIASTRPGWASPRRRRPRRER